MGKGLRSNVKKAVKRARRAILEESSTLLKEREAGKQAVLQKILATPVVHREPERNRQRSSERRRGRLDSDDSASEDEQVKMEEDHRLAFNVTETNAMRRFQKRSKYLRRNLRANQFVVTECEKRRIAKQRSKTDTVTKLELNLGLKTAQSLKPRDDDQMDITRITVSTNKQKWKEGKRKLPPGSDWMRIHKLVKGRRPAKRAVKRRYRIELKGITQHYPIKKEEMSLDE